MTPSDNDKQSQPVSPPPVLPASWHAEESLENKKYQASGHSQFASAYIACCLAFLHTCQSTNVSECYRPVRKRIDPTARRGLGVSDALASGPMFLLNYVGVDAQCEAATHAIQHQQRLEPLCSPFELCSSWACG